MSWECECGVVNKDSKGDCRACGTPRGMVWTPEGFNPPAEAATLKSTVSERQGYGWGGFLVVAAIINIFRALSGTPEDPSGSTAEAFVYTLVANAAGWRKPWGWYVLLFITGLNMAILALAVVAGVADGSPELIIGGFLVVAVNAAWFIYFYKRRAMFGAKGRWKWFERTFPSFVGPDGETSPATVELRRQSIASGVKTRENVMHTGGDVTPLGKDPEYFYRQCPKCAEQIHLEAIRCRYCDLEFDPEEVASSIAPIIDEYGRLYDISSEVKQCPACAETVKVGAYICRYCKQEFTPTDVEISKMKALREKVNGVRRKLEPKQVR